MAINDTDATRKRRRVADPLRKYIAKRDWTNRETDADLAELSACIYAIETDHERRMRQEESEIRSFCERVEGATKDKDELDLFGVAYMPIPTDMDGVPVRVGDMLQVEGVGRWCKPFKVDRISLGRGGWSAQEKSGVRHPVGACRHYRDPTVEDVLREFASERIKLFFRMPMFVSDEEIEKCQEENSEACEKLIAEFAAKLRLKEESE